MQARVTMWDVARAAGVSQATASIVLGAGDNSRISKETSDRVRDAARTLGYRRNEMAKALREGYSTIIGFIGDRVASSPFAGSIVEGAQERAWDDERLLVVANTEADARLESAAVEQMLGHQIRQFVYASMYNRSVTVPDALRAYDVVVLNAQDPTGGAWSVAPDEVRGGREATQHLLDHGHRRVAMINIGDLESGLPAATGRHDGYRDALRDAGIAYTAELVRSGGGGTSSGYVHTRELMALAEPPTAIFCANDRTAWGALQALAELGLSVPGDVSIVGFDNQELIAAETRPGLTTMNLPFREMGRTAVEILLANEAEDRRGEPAASVRVHCPLVERESVASPRKVR